MHPDTVRTSRARSTIGIESAELAASPEEEQQELALIYQAKGIPPEQAQALSQRLIANKSGALDTLVREELGIDPAELGGSAWTAAAGSFVLFALGALVPVAPFLLVGQRLAIPGSAALSGVALLAIGAGTSLFTGRGVVFSALRQPWWASPQPP